MRVRCFQIALAVTMFIPLAWGTPAAQRKGPPPAEVPGAAEIRCAPDDVLCHDGGTYVDDALLSNPEGVSAALRSNDREFKLSILNEVFPPERSFTIRFPSSKVAPPLGFECSGSVCTADDVVALLGREITSSVIPGTQNSGMSTNLVDGSGNTTSGGLTGLDVLESSQSRFLIGFPDPDGRSYRWALYWNPSLYAGTSHVTVTRANTCEWTIEADANAVAGLILFSQGRGKTTTSYEGRFTMPFSITFTTSDATLGCSAPQDR